MLTLIATPVAAQGTGLACMGTTYSSEQLASVPRLGASVSASEDVVGTIMRGAGDLAAPAVRTCAEREGWDQERMQAAMFYEMGRLAEIAVRGSSVLTQGQIANLDAALESGDTSRLWELVERQVTEAMGGPAADLTQADIAYLGQYVVDAGVMADEPPGTSPLETGQKVGVLLATMALQRMASREFP
ncbi:hypothetical protein AAW00_04965 [Aurantiacibacter luteus]|uniref:Uncharacterized protein n=2 Tax=Aurantiacibacter luteus TaxID=1581420 RepID=A0A0G9MYX2_9SPHN|nr:hypothetical protein AAW00_04965 [Aurantiacibacter luteus]